MDSEKLNSAGSEFFAYHQPKVNVYQQQTILTLPNPHFHPRFSIYLPSFPQFLGKWRKFFFLFLNFEEDQQRIEEIKEDNDGIKEKMRVSWIGLMLIDTSF